MTAANESSAWPFSAGECGKLVGISFASLFAGAAWYLTMLDGLLRAQTTADKLIYGAVTVVAAVATVLVVGLGSVPLIRRLSLAFRCALTSTCPPRPPAPLRFFGGYLLLIGGSLGLALLYGIDATTRAEPGLHGLSALGIALVVTGGSFLMLLPASLVLLRRRAPGAAAPQPTAQRDQGIELDTVGMAVALGLCLAVAVDGGVAEHHRSTGLHVLRPHAWVEGDLEAEGDERPPRAELRYTGTAGEVVQLRFAGGCRVNYGTESTAFRTVSEQLEDKPWSLTAEILQDGPWSIVFDLGPDKTSCHYSGRFLPGATR